MRLFAREIIPRFRDIPPPAMLEFEHVR
jgi:hypothetical protein